MDGSPIERDELLAASDTLAARLAPSAVERDARGGVPREERALLRQSPLPFGSIPRSLGGGEASWTTLLETVRRIAEVDASIAHVLAYQHLLLSTVRLFGREEQYAQLARATVDHRWLWGNALNPRDTRTRARRIGEHLVVDGIKSFSSGARDADVLVFSTLETPNDVLRIAVVPLPRAGVVLVGDWDAFGQRQTDSGTVELHQVVLARDELLLEPGPLGNVRATLRPLLAQLSLTAVYAGIADGALAASVAAARERETSDDLALALIGELAADAAATRALFAEAVRRFDAAWSLGDDVAQGDRDALALAAAAAKSVATRNGLTITTRAIEVAGARATGRGRGLDRYFRDLRVHTLHDPVAHKHRDLGRALLEARAPTPSFYS